MYSWKNISLKFQSVNKHRQDLQFPVLGLVLARRNSGGSCGRYVYNQDSNDSCSEQTDQLVELAG